MGNHSTKKNAKYKIYDFSSRQALLDPVSVGDVSVGGCIVLLATCDIEKDEQILCNYEPSTGSTMDIPFANISLGQCMKICYRSVRKSVCARIFFEKCRRGIKVVHTLLQTCCADI